MKNSLVNLLFFLKSSFKQECSKIILQRAINLIQFKYISQKSFIINITKQISYFIYDNKKYIGPLLNHTCKYIKKHVKIKSKFIHNLNNFNMNISNISIPVINYNIGSKHPIIKICEKVIYSFESLGFELTTGPEIEHTFYNFDKLNINYNHPSRSKIDTFYIKKNVVLRTHTSSIQTRIIMALKKKLPIRIISYGKVYRKDSDKTHLPMFHQLEGLYIDKNIGFSDLKGTLTNFIHNFFEKKMNIRWRTSSFPFTKPSCEIDIECKCLEKKCKICKGSKWIEVMGAGLVNPTILDKVGINTNVYNGFAFGIGIERLAMIYYELNDMKYFFENTLQSIYTF